VFVNEGTLNITLNKIKMKKSLLFTVLFLITFSVGFSQINLVKDIALGTAFSAPRGLNEVNGKLIFATDVPYNTAGNLWKSDGTLAGTSIIRTFGLNESITFTKKWGNLIYFNVGKNGAVQSLWVTDGNGAYLVKSLGSTSATGEMTVFKNALYFNTSSLFAQGIHKSDGTSAGTVGFANITASSPLVVSGTNMYFTTYVAAYGSELWKTDGTVAGTVLVKDINPGGVESSISQMTDVNGTLFFIANNGVNGNELWKSDGTAAGTVMVKDITLGGIYSHTICDYLTNVNGILYFTKGTYELWKSDGTEAGTVLVRPSTNIKSTSLINVNGTLFFECGTLATGAEICKTDGTTAGTVMVKNTNVSGTGYGGFINPYVVETNVYFRAQNGSNGYELWKSDGTEAGTVMVYDTNLGASDFNPEKLTTVGNKLFMVGQTDAEGIELFVYNLPALSLKIEINSAQVSLYPNPSKGNFNIEIDEALIGSKATVYNLLGQKIKDFKLNTTITNQTLNKGIYFLEIEKEGVKTTKKLIVN
jgi:ELWxxDGT repeat protein